MRKLFIMATAALLTTGCANNKQQESKNTDCDNATVGQPVIDGHSANISLDYWGTYTGTLPCADCQGIATELTLNEDGSFLLKTVYQGKNNKQATEESGKYTWNDNGNIIMLEGVVETSPYYFVRENNLLQLNRSGNRIEGEQADKYILNKQ